MKQRHVILIVGTRPEAIKMAPVHVALREAGRLEPVVVSTGQHRELLDDVLGPLGIMPRHRLEVMQPGQTLNGIVVRVVDKLSPLLEAAPPAALLVQGDTTSALAAALAAYQQRIPVGHVEAGLRTYDHEHPFPEEANRQLVDRISTWCFAPTSIARDNLIAERIPENRIRLTGNTIVDALLWASKRSTFACEPQTVLITLHRRESHGEPLRQILSGLADFLEATPEAAALWPLHPNPAVSRALESVGELAGRVRIVKPMDYVAFGGALATCKLVLTDSGGIQEEAPSIGKIALVAREKTERPEGLAGGRNRLVGRSRESVREGLLRAWSEPPYEGPLPAPNPFGDGKAGRRIAAEIESVA